FVVSADDSGVTIQGADGATVGGTITVEAGADRVVLQRLHVLADVRIDGSNDVVVHDSVLEQGVVLAGSTGARIVHSVLGGDAGVFVALDASDVAIEFNQIRGATGIRVLAPVTGRIANNDVQAVDIGIDIQAAIAGAVENNDVHGAQIAVRYAAPASLNGNRIYAN